MAIIKDDAVILRRLDYSETSQVLAVFTRMHGKVRLIAKGIKRSTKDKFAAGLDLLDIGHLTFSARNVRQEALATLTEWVQSQAGAALRDALDRLLAAQYAAFVAAELTEDWDPHPELYDGICNAIRALAEGARPVRTLVAFQRCLLQEIGSFPILDACVGCQRPTPAQGVLYFSSLDGGLLCRDCESARSEKLELNRDTLGCMINKGDDPDSAIDAFRVFDYHLTHLMGKPNPLLRMFLSAC
ncbi:MAG: DNA repair protein RecO [Phycisphaerales bacterium]|nr:DNA repair protein RecO [Phycisphaerales bacterium]